MFSKSTEYALRATIYIAQESNSDKKLSLNQIAIAIDSPPSFTAKILQLLTKDNCIISSVRGPNGGFYITEDAKQLPIRKVLEAMDEQDLFVKCILGLNNCSETKPCPMHYQYQPIKKQLIKLFETKTILQLADPSQPANFLVNNSL